MVRPGGAVLALFNSSLIGLLLRSFPRSWRLGVVALPNINSAREYWCPGSMAATFSSGTRELAQEEAASGLLTMPEHCDLALMAKAHAEKKQRYCIHPSQYVTAQPLLRESKDRLEAIPKPS